MLLQILMIGLLIWLMKTPENVRSKLYNGPDKRFYEKFDRRVIPGMHQQLMSFQNVAFAYGTHGFELPCDKFDWTVFDGHSFWERPATCEIIGQGIYKFGGLEPCTMNLVYMNPKKRIDISESRRTPLYLKTQCDQPLEPVKSHLVVSAGPGWIVVRFPVEKHFMYMAGYRLAYRKLGDPNWVKTRLHEYIVWSRIVPRVKPFIPCPPWKEYSMFCLMATDHIRVVDDPFALYEAQIQGIGVMAAGEHDFRYVNYKFIFRALNCDVFDIDKCPPAFGYVDADPIEATMSDEEYLEKYPPSPGDPHTLRPIDRAKLKAARKKTQMVDRDVSMAVLGAFLLLIIILLLFIVIFCFAKRRARERTLANWYFISSATWPVNYTLRLPPDLPHTDKGVTGRGTAEDVHMDVISQRPMMGMATKHRTWPEGEQPKKDGGGGGK